MSSPTYSGNLVTIEGIDGSGKSTLLSLMQEKLSAHRTPVLFTKEPGGTPLGKHLLTFLHEEKKHLCDMAE